MRSPSKKTVLFSLAALALVSIAVGQSVVRMRAAMADGQPSGANREGADLVAVTFSSQWCGPCKILKPRLATLKPEFANMPVRFIELSFTFGEQDDFPALAAQEGFTQVYNQYRNATGFTVLVDRDGGGVIDILTMDHETEVMRAKIERALVQAQT